MLRRVLSGRVVVPISALGAVGASSSSSSSSSFIAAAHSPLELKAQGSQCSSARRLELTGKVDHAKKEEEEWVTYSSCLASSLVNSEANNNNNNNNDNITIMNKTTSRSNPTTTTTTTITNRNGVLSSVGVLQWRIAKALLGCSGGLSSSHNESVRTLSRNSRMLCMWSGCSQRCFSSSSSAFSSSSSSLIRSSNLSGVLRMGVGSSSSSSITHGVGSLSTSRRYAGVDLLSPLAKLGQSRDLAADLKAGRARNNKEIIASFEQIKTFDEIHYRKSDRPWELVPKYAKKRVSDLVGILSTEHRMEIEQAIDKMQSLCDVDMYVVLVPTVGYVSPRAFCNSIFFDWQIGEPKGNGLLLVISQHEATVQLVASPAIEEYFDVPFLDPVVREIFQPLVREGKPSLATVQLVYAIARQAQEMRPRWEGGLLPMPTRNRVRFAAKTVQWSIKKAPYLIFGSLFFILCTVVLINQLLDTLCPECHHAMNRVRDVEGMRAIMSPGQFIEQKNECAFYHVWKCPHCPNGHRVTLSSRDLHQSNKCLKCVDCNFYTCSLEKEVERLPTKTEDGIKRVVYKCEQCHIGREILLPLYRPIDTNAAAIDAEEGGVRSGNDNWYNFLIEQSQSHKEAKTNTIKL